MQNELVTQTSHTNLSYIRTEKEVNVPHLVIPYDTANNFLIFLLNRQNFPLFNILRLLRLTKHAVLCCYSAKTIIFLSRICH